LCGCAYDAPPSGPASGECDGAVAFHIENGHLDDIDLSGTGYVVYYYWPTKLTDGDMECVYLIDEDMPDEQADALERILYGKEGGAFTDVLPYIARSHPLRRTSITWSGGDPPSVTVGDEAVIRLEPFRGLNGELTEVTTSVSNATWTLGHTVYPAKGVGRGFSLRGSFEPAHGESGFFEYES
jgi:hypothetical protein